MHDWQVPDPAAFHVPTAQGVQVLLTPGQTPVVLLQIPAMDGEPL